MAIKVYGYVRSFDDGEGGTIIFKASGNLYPLYKSFTGRDLMVAYDEYITLSRENGRRLETEMGIPLESLEKLSNEERADKILAAKVHFSQDGSDFINSVLLAMFLNGLPAQAQNEALASGLDCLPPHFYKDIEIVQNVLSLLTQFITSTKKN